MLVAAFIFDLPRTMIIASFIVNAIVYVVVSLLTPKPSEHIKRMYFDEVEEFLEEKA
jgi:hypothetical protein